MSNATTTASPETTTELNGLNPQAIGELISTVDNNPAEAFTNWDVTTRWQGGAVTETQVSHCQVGQERIERDFRFRVDEPEALGGTNTHANPQEHLLGAMNACMAVVYVTLASLQGIELESLEIQTKGDIDLRGLFALDDNVKAGYEALDYTVRIKGNGTPDQFQAIHEAVKKTSPNYFNIANAIKLNADLVVE